MCGPADYEALYTCTERLAALSAAGLSTYTVRQLAEMVRKPRRRLGARAVKSENGPPGVPLQEDLLAADR